MNKRRGFFILILAFVVFELVLFIIFPSRQSSFSTNKVPTIDPLLTPIASPIPSPSPTPVKISFSQMNAKYGPCVQVPVLMYHHIQTEANAKKQHQQSLSVDPKYFKMHLQYLKDKNYSVISPKDLINFFNNGVALPQKSVMITLDDAYEDNYFNAFPILKEFNYSAVIFTPTGLMNVPDYLNWDEISQMKSLLYFGNHTWSHHASSGSSEVLKKEISLADTQLSEHGLNPDKVFAYPYGNPSNDAQKILTDLNYQLAFTTTHGSILCKAQRFILPRIRVGNGPLSSYGL